MASRRTRIKGIANIPLRKKPTSNSENADTRTENEEIRSNNGDSKVLLEDVTTSMSTTSDILNISGAKSIKNPAENNNIDNTAAVSNKVVYQESYKVEDISELEENSLESFRAEPGFTKDLLTKVDTSSTQQLQELPREKLSLKEVNALENVKKTSKTNIVRRKFVKPGVNLNLAMKRDTSNKQSPVVQSKNNSNTSMSTQTPKLESIDSICNNDNNESNIQHSTCHSNSTGKIQDDKKDNESPRRNKCSEVKLNAPTDSNIDTSHIDFNKIEALGDNMSDVQPTCTNPHTEITLNETHLFVNNVPSASTSAVSSSPVIKKIIPDTQNVAPEFEYPIPPPSPSKINRSRFKAIPKLHYRKTSLSTSESEDETRKYGRIRNNSVCSVISTLEPPVPISEVVPSREAVQIFQKKNRTDQAKKLSEAKKEFQRRFGSNDPDKQRLKMIDLIFYNPSSNPMSNKRNKTVLESPELQQKEESVNQESENQNSNHVVEEKNEKIVDEDDSMPVPQIKIGPSGEIVVDERSLVVENVEVSKQKEQIQNSQVVDGDIETGYGIFKKASRSKDWTPKETLRFYKALNLIGTDFTLMCHLFPKRTRRELKIKFKREEKTNQQLIDKAIMHPCHYNFESLKREFQIEDEQEEMLKKLKEDELEMKKKERLRLSERKRKARETAKDDQTPEKLLKETEPSETIQENLQVKEKKEVKLKKKEKGRFQRKPKTKSINIKAILESDSDADVSGQSESDDKSESSDDDEETDDVIFLQPTRSGRLPRSTRRYQPTFEEYRSRKQVDFLEVEPPNELEFPGEKPFLPSILTNRKSQNSEDEFDKPLENKRVFRERRSSSISSLDSTTEKLVPGAVVILTEDDDKVNTKYKVYMVTPERKLTPLDLDPEVVAKLVKQYGVCSEDELPSVPENNVTIPAPEQNVECS